MALDHQRIRQRGDFVRHHGQEASPGGGRRRAAAHEEHALLGFQQIDSQAFVAGSVIGKDCGSSGRWCGVVT